MESKYLSKQVQRILNISFKHVSKPQLKNLADVIVALFFNTSFTLREIASKIPGESNVKHKLKRLVYFLDTLSIDEEFFKSYVKVLFSLPNFCFRRRKYLTILLDTTTLLDDFMILSASISYKGRAIPIYVRIWEGIYEKYDFKARVREFLHFLSKILPKHNYELVADRGFQGYDMVNIFKESGWDYVIRLQKNYCVKKKESPSYIQLSLFEDGFYEEATIGKGRPIEKANLVVNSITNEEGEKVKWYLLTTLKDGERAVADYSRRMWIEESFKDLKGILRWESYTKKIPQKKRLEKMIIISCLSYAIRLSLGSEIEIPPSEESKTSVIKRFEHIISSSYRSVKKLFSILVTSFRLNYQRSQHYYNLFFG